MPTFRRRTVVIALTAALTAGAAVAATAASALTIEQGGCPGEAGRIAAERVEREAVAKPNPLKCY